VAAVAVGAFAAAAAGQTLQAGVGAPDDVTPLADSKDASAAMGVGGNSAAVAPEILTVAKVTETTPVVESQKIVASQSILQARAAAIAAAQAEANRPKVVSPAQGALTSSFGARWGTTHYGLDIANRIGTPIVAAADGVVIEAGPASGFGLWVRIEHSDGTVTVYGHMDTFSVREGQQVKAGEQIARMGNRGYSTGPHLHFEVWDTNGKKLNPKPWLSERGVDL
jgi:murein DD-endopeptidase MepM/ murein hydrolase activator NlpD